MAEIDDIRSEANAMMKTMLQLATLVALRTRERGQKEAEATVKLKAVREKEHKELAQRQLRMEKAQDPRNRELDKMIERAGVTLNKQREQVREFNAMGLEQEERSRVQVMERERMGPGYDSPESRAIFAMELAEAGLEPELIELRMLVDGSHSKPLIEAVREPINDATLIIDKEQEALQRARELRRER